MIKDITLWIENPNHDYTDGVRLLELHCGNPNLVRYYANRSPRFAMAGLVEELRHLKPIATATDPTPSVPVAAHTPTPTVPAVAVEAKRQVHELWVKLSKIHSDLFDTGEGNGEKEIAARLLMMKERDPLIERYNSLYEAKEAFFAGKLTEAQLQEVVDGKTIDHVLHPEPAKEKTPLRALTDIQLTKKAKAAKAAITRCKNQLRYQQDTAAKTDNPMPDCPKRKEIETRLKDREAELAVLTEEIKRRNL